VNATDRLRSALDALDEPFLVAHEMMRASGMLFVGVTEGEGTIVYSFGPWDRLLGWRQSELRGMNLSELIHPDDVARTMDVVEGRSRVDTLADAGEGATVFRNRYRMKDGRFRWMSWRASDEYVVGSFRIGAAQPGRVEG
jgi:PAS domain S-box-containing protein